jgi:hypothetical protein
MLFALNNFIQHSYVGCDIHTSNSKMLSHAAQLTEIAFAVRKAANEFMHEWEELYSVHNKKVFCRVDKSHTSYQN